MNSDAGDPAGEPVIPDEDGPETPDVDDQVVQGVPGRGWHCCSFGGIWITGFYSSEIQNGSLPVSANSTRLAGVFAPHALLARVLWKVSPTVGFGFVLAVS